MRLKIGKISYVKTWQKIKTILLFDYLKMVIGIA